MREYRYTMFGDIEYRYTMFGDKIPLKGSDNLQELIKVAEAYKEYYKELYVQDNNDYNMVWCN